MQRPRPLASCAVIVIVTGLTVASAQELSRPYVGRTWISTDAIAAPNTLRIFLPDGTLVMHSCTETYRLTTWHSIGKDLIEWREDTARIQAEVSQPRPNELRLRLRLRNETKEEHYKPAKVPFVCPDSRPSPATTGSRR